MSGAEPRRDLLVAVFAVAVLFCACGPPDAPGDAGVSATVRFEHHAETQIDGSVASQFAACVALVGATHIHPSWLNFVAVTMEAQGGPPWVAEFERVPADRSLRIRVSDPNACADNSTGAVTWRTVYANGVLLTRRTDTPGAGNSTEPGFSFFLAADGVVTP